MRSRPEAGLTDQDWEEKRAQNMVTVDNDGAKQAVLRSVDEIFNVRRATRKISHPSHSLYETFKSVPVFFLGKTHQAGEAYKSRARVVALATSCRAAGGRPCALRRIWSIRPEYRGYVVWHSGHTPTTP